MGAGANPLTMEQAKGAKLSIVVVMLILLLFVVVLVAGSPIVALGNEPSSVVYSVAIYLPVVAVCILAYRRIH